MEVLQRGKRDVGRDVQDVSSSSNISTSLYTALTQCTTRRFLFSRYLTYVLDIRTFTKEREVEIQIKCQGFLQIQETR